MWNCFWGGGGGGGGGGVMDVFIVVAVNASFVMRVLRVLVLYNKAQHCAGIK